MSVAERCRSLRLRIAQRNEMLRANKDADAIRSRIDELRELRAALQLRVQQRSILASRQIQIDGVRDPAQLAESLRELARKVLENYDETGRQLGNAKRSLGTLSNQLTSSVENAVKNLKGGIPASDEVFLRQVELIPSYASKVAHIRAERDAMLGGSDPTTSPEALSNFLAHMETLKTVSDTLDPAEFPKDVLKFFNAARHNRARLDDLTPDVRGWLEQQDLIKKIRLTIVS